MIKRTTWIMLALFLALAGFALYQRYAPNSTTAQATPSATVAPVEFLFPADQGVVVALTLESREGHRLRAVRQEEAWRLLEPIEAAAQAGSMEAATSQLTSLSVVTRLDLNPADVGLDPPAYTITVEFSNGQTLTAWIGDVTPTGNGYYARKNDGSIVVIRKHSVDSLLSLLESPPYAETPTPSPTPSPTPTPTPNPPSDDVETSPAGIETPSATPTP